tara:strand:+ start:4015 stop:5208 length:1194 start_codon:yes stop_codon:yes gene_type:complete
MDSSAAGFNSQSLSTLGNSGAQFAAQKNRQEAMLEYEEPDMKNKSMVDSVNEGLGTSGSLSKFGKGAKDFASKYQELKNKGAALGDTVKQFSSGLENAFGSNSSTPVSKISTKLQTPSMPLQPGSQEANYDNLASKGLQAEHKSVVSSMDDVTAEGTKSLIKADPVAGKNPNAAGTSLEDRNAILNKRSDIINQKSSPTAEPGRNPLNDDTVDSLGGDLHNAANRFVSSQGSFMDRASSAVKNMFGGANSVTQGGADIASSVRAATNNGINGARGAIANGASNLHATVQSGVDDATRGAKMVTGAADDVASMASKGLELGGTVLDALGPVGDLLGLGMAIFGGAEASHQESVEKKAQADAQSAMAAPVTAGQGTGGAMTTATLDTSHPGQAVASSHF